MATGESKQPKAPRPRFREHPLELMLGLFGEVRPGEAATVLLLALNVFLLLTAYYLLKVAREPLILLGGGAEVKSYASVGQSVLLILVASAYGWVASRVGCMRLVTSVTLFFVANLVVFWVLGVAGVHLGVPFFLWVGIFNVVTIAQFWSFAADTYTDEQGKRLFPIVGIGSSVGAVAGSVAADPLIRLGSPFTLMLVAAGFLGAALVITHVIHRRESRRAVESGAEQSAPDHGPVGRSNAFALVFRDRYLVIFALLVLVLNFVTKSGDYVFDRMLLLQAPAKAHALGLTESVYIGQFKARYFQWINGLGMIMQLFLVSRLVKYVGLRAVLVLIPMVSLGGYGTAIAFPLISVLFVGRVAESTLDYSLSNTAQQSLWLSTTREVKYKAKQVIDTFFKRAGDTMSGGMVWLGAHFALGAVAFLTVNVVFSLVWIGLAIALAREVAKREAAPADAGDASRSAPAARAASPGGKREAA